MRLIRDMILCISATRPRHTRFGCEEAALDCSADDPDYGGAHQGVAAAPFVGDEPGAEGSDEGAGGHGGCDLEVKG